MANLVTKAKVKEKAKTMGYRFPDSTVDELDKKVEEIITKAGKRAEANKRTTIMSYDL